MPGSRTKTVIEFGDVFVCNKQGRNEQLNERMIFE